MNQENEKERITKEKALAEQTVVIEHLFKEIEMRCDAFKNKANLSTLSEMSDHQVMEADKRLIDLDKDFGEILEKVTVFVQRISGCNAQDKLERVAGKRDSISTVKENFFEGVKKEIKDRDLSEEKLKNALSLNLELPKFCGYESELDIFTFKREFGKLVEPYLTKRHYSDSLKRKYLSGQALVLVENIDEIDKIWKKLEDTFGDVQLLLQNKNT